jgi:bifunctional non-homologous end joining protein LigD
MGLAEYKRKRDFARTAEPKGKPLPKSVKGAARFVIQKHDASRLHYDFRLEMDGVLKSWALPKGLPWKQGEKHLAVEVEDHPVDYGAFEGIIPKGQYGGGNVMLWDKGKYYVYGENPLKSWGEGKLHLVLDGAKAKGEWTLIRLRGDSGKNWLILKTGSSLKPVSKKLDDQSVKTGRTMKQIAAEHDAEWQSGRRDESPTNKFRARIQAAVAETARGLKKKDSREGKTVEREKVSPGRNSSRRRRASTQSGLDGQLGELSLPAMKPRFIEPMKPKLVETPPAGGDWFYELKFDGIRALAIKNEKKFALFSRNQNELGARFPEIVAAVKDLPTDEFVIDGEIVALDERGRSSFQLLQALEMEGRKAPLYYYVFDFLQAEGKNLMPLPLETRKALLSKLRGGVGDPIRYSAEIGRDAEALLKEIKRLGLEGIVGKQRHSVYEPGRRSGAWIKLKCVNEQEFVIGGYTPPAGSRKYFGAVLVGYYDKDGKKKGGGLRFAGKVGTGFTGKSLAALHRQFQAERRKDCPFVDLPSKEGGKWVQGITPGEMRKCTWLNPVFVCQVKFAEWTRDGKLRQPVFLGLREDKDAREVRREV